MQGKAWAVTYDARDVIPPFPTEHDAIAALLAIAVAMIHPSRAERARVKK